MVLTLSPYGDSVPSSPEKIISCLCSDIRDVTERCTCVGILISEKCKHKVRVSGPVSSDKTVSLAELLSQKKPSQRERLKLGVRLASSVLKLQSTGWLQPRWGKQDIFLIQGDSSQSSHSLETPVIRLAFPRGTSVAESSVTSVVESSVTSVVEVPETSVAEAPKPPAAEVPETSVAEAPEISVAEAPVTSVIETPVASAEVPEPPAAEVPETSVVEAPETPAVEASELLASEPLAAEEPESPTVDALETAIVNCNLSLLSLGIILMELWFWQDIGTPQVNELQANKPQLCCHLEQLDIERSMKAKRKIPELRSKAGRGYSDCVKRCLDGLDYTENPKEFMREAHQKVLRPLEKNLKHFCDQELEQIFSLEKPES